MAEREIAWPEVNPEDVIDPLLWNGDLAGFTPDDSHWQDICQKHRRSECPGKCRDKAVAVLEVRRNGVEHVFYSSYRTVEGAVRSAELTLARDANTVAWYRSHGDGVVPPQYLPPHNTTYHLITKD